MIYLDYAATTPCSQEVLEAMLPFFRETFANAASIDHIPGVAARKAVDIARESVAMLVGARPEDVIFTSGSTESNNLVMSTSRSVITTRLEHPSVLEPFLARQVPNDAFVATDCHGTVDYSALRAMTASSKRSTLVSIIATNNETGLEQDLESLQAVLTETGSILHVDATQATLTRSISVRRHGIAAVSISGHKIYGPKGVGALVVLPSLRNELRPLVRGGGHERGLRSGTLPVPLIVGFGRAAELARLNHAIVRQCLESLREAFLSTLRETLSEPVVETIPANLASPHILSLRIKGTNSRALLGTLVDEVAFSLGSACSTNKTEPSHVLIGLGIDRKGVSETFRISFSPELRMDDVQSAAKKIAMSATRLSSYSVSA